MWQRRVTGRRGATVRKNIETSSAIVGVLAHGTKIQCYETVPSAAGVARCRVVAPLRGWVSRKCLDRGDPVLEAHPPGLDAPSFVHVVVHGHGGDGSIVRDGYWRAAADRRPDCLFVAPSAPDGSWYELWLDRAGAAPYAALDGDRRRRLRTAFGVSRFRNTHTDVNRTGAASIWQSTLRQTALVAGRKARPTVYGGASTHDGHHRFRHLLQLQP